MKTFKDVAATYQQDLQSLYPSEEIKQLFSMTYAFIMEEKRTHYALHYTDEIPESKSSRFVAFLEELKTGRPIQHILGKADFYGLYLSVNEHTLIPRSETEELVDWIIAENGAKPRLSILDIGTGSGCIALALKQNIPQATVDAIDIQKEAIQVARANGKEFDLDVNFIEADILEWDSFLQATQQYDVIVSNPPYITPAEQKEMHKNVLLYEPHTALFVEEQAPLLFYDTIADLGKKHLSPQGSIYFEINQYLSRQTSDLLSKKGYGEVTVRRDLNGVDRMIKTRCR